MDTNYYLRDSYLEKKKCPYVTVGIMDRQLEVGGCFDSIFVLNDEAEVKGNFTAKVVQDNITFHIQEKNILYSGENLRFKNKGDSTFTLFDVTIGINFHWEKKEEQSFRGDLILKKRPEGTIAVINEISLEDYLESVVSSEMKSTAPFEFLKAHAIISRSWIISALRKKSKGMVKEAQEVQQKTNLKNNDEIIHWYEQEGHDLYDVCADDHCQRYQGIKKVLTENPVRAVRDTCGVVLTFNGEVCDTRYSKACGGITEEYRSVWKDMDIPYLKSISDGEKTFTPILTEEDAKSWVTSKPNAYCNIADANTLKKILPEFDLKTGDFFRWKISYSREELEEIIKRKSGLDLGTLKEIIPLKRGPSGRIYLMEIKGSKKTVRIGKELEIRRWLSNTHLLSSAFVIEPTYNSSGEIKEFTFYGAGWGHGVGLCQIGAGYMALKGYTAEEILMHYFPGTILSKIY
ncbi:MAG: SpoIID/LytB domain-containing protein [Syntrophorhabdaceae bacterium]|nr:SpoIID/LytB domain-containing protein [Syntrophorhabdaceae bacterium]